MAEADLVTRNNTAILKCYPEQVAHTPTRGTLGYKKDPTEGLQFSG